MTAAATIKPIDAIKIMRQSVESMHAAKTERIGSPSCGDVVRQGDLYLVCIESMPVGKATDNRQLAPGNTQGSRHILSGDVTIVTSVDYQSLKRVAPESFAKRDLESVLVGPAFSCNSDVEVTHPEHGHKVLPEGTVWQVIYQQALADVVRRAKD